MKKQLIITSLACLAFSSCGVAEVAAETATKKCETAISKYTSEIGTWAADPTNKAKCTAAKASIEAMVNACDTYAGWTAANRAQYKKDLADWKCD